MPLIREGVTMTPYRGDGGEGYEVRGLFDRGDVPHGEVLILNRKRGRRSRWRAFSAEYIAGYNGSNWGQGQTLHVKLRAFRDTEGHMVDAQFAEACINKLDDLYAREELLPL